MEQDVYKLPVMNKTCKTCPFRKNDKNCWQNMELAQTVIERNLFKSQQICHGTEGLNREAKNRCRGYFDYSFMLYKKMGLNPEVNLKNNPKILPTDE